LIPRNFIQEWRQHAPWSQDAQLEQDLIICRALVEIFSHPELAANLAFRGGTALFKLYLAPMRYSEDIDLVQITAGPIGPIMSTLQEKLNSWLGNPKRKQSEGRVTLTYRMESEDGLPLKLKIEINSREHFALLGYKKHSFDVDSRWFSGSVSIPTYQLDELLGTKVRALYQRKKGRDLFDLWAAFNTTNAQPQKVINCFLHYMENEGHKVSRAEFEKNLSEKLNDHNFIRDIEPLIIANTGYDFSKAAALVMNKLVPLIPGEPWQKRKSDLSGR
jgi:predicted nucleotidyltransferase component of viral defense system